MRSCIIAAALAAAGGAFAQTGTFVITDGPGIGTSLNAVFGAVNQPIQGHIGNINPPTITAPGPSWHYNGLLNFLPDPSPAGLGWGHVNFPALVTPPTITSAAALAPGPPAARPSIRLVPGPVAPPKPFFTPQSARDVIALQTRNSSGTGALFAAPPPQGFREVNFVHADALHSLKRTPMPLGSVSRTRTSRAVPRSLWDFQLTGPGAKLAPSAPQKIQP